MPNRGRSSHTGSGNEPHVPARGGSGAQELERRGSVTLGRQNQPVDPAPCGRLCVFCLGPSTAVGDRRSAASVSQGVRAKIEAPQGRTETRETLSVTPRSAACRWGGGLCSWGSHTSSTSPAGQSGVGRRWRESSSRGDTGGSGWGTADGASAGRKSWQGFLGFPGHARCHSSPLSTLRGLRGRLPRSLTLVPHGVFVRAGEAPSCGHAHVDPRAPGPEGGRLRATAGSLL